MFSFRPLKPGISSTVYFFSSACSKFDCEIPLYVLEFLKLRRGIDNGLKLFALLDPGSIGFDSCPEIGEFFTFISLNRKIPFWLNLRFFPHPSTNLQRTFGIPARLSSIPSFICAILRNLRHMPLKKA